MNPQTNHVDGLHRGQSKTQSCADWKIRTTAYALSTAVMYLSLLHHVVNKVACFPHLWDSRFIMILFLSVALPKFPANWLWLRRHVSTQAKENQDFCSAVLCHHIYNVPVQLHFPGPLALLLQVRLSPLGQLLLQRDVRLSAVHDGAGGRPLVCWALQSVHPPSDDQGEQCPLWGNL